MTPPEPHSTPLAAAIAAARAAPLSRKRAMLAALLIDRAIDEHFEASGKTDILAFRAELAAAHPALGVVMALAAMIEPGPRLVLEPVAVPPADHPTLGVEDYMVSLYNSGTVFRLRLALPDGTRRDAHEVLADAARALRPLPPPRGEGSAAWPKA